MRWSTVVLSMSLVAALTSVSHAQTYSTAPRSQSVTYPGPYAPGCATPGMPSSSIPSIGSGIPGTDSTPGTGTTPGSAEGGAGAGAAAAAAAAPSPSASGGESGSDSLASAAPHMIGDLIGYGSGRNHRGSRAPIVTRGPFKISENESPRPTDRVFATFNYFNGVKTGDSSNDLYRGVVGFEKTALDGNASFGVRAPVQSSRGTVDGFGDVSIITKYAFINDTQTGTVASGGLVLTVPTGRSFTLSDGHRLDAVLIQPWVGGIAVMGDAYALGFSSIIASTDSRDPTLYTLDVGVGYRIFQSNTDDLITSITPTIEGHLTTSFDNNHNFNGVNLSDQLIITGGVHIGLMNQAYLTIGGAVPITGGRLNDFEVIAQFNYRF